ncbi:hypothetical protein BC936DRAFT_137776 [Jimgerdemannia flammicorona]|uniref:Uncharacterized protein n=1 Tax=Jimgerdemannia flammicorona TaxID=994334 RepID=A0A433CWR0_9FUNG|nr:hypothetical protein BC936DRAFT_137776 [Jimgerdemannia flammicorona]
MSELGVGELVQPAGSDDGEVTPDVVGGAEVELLHDARGGLKPGVWVLSSDTDGDDMALGCGLALGLGGLRDDEVEVDLVGTSGLHAIEDADVADAMQRDAHGNLELSGGKVDAGDHLRCRMLNLETGVELKEVEVVLRVRIEVLDRAGGDVAHELGEPDRRLLHRLESILLGNRDGRLLNDLLVATLDGAVAPEERNGVAVLIGKELNLEMACVAGELHDEDGRAGNLAQDLGKRLFEKLVGLDLTDTLAATAL